VNKINDINKLEDKINKNRIELENNFNEQINMWITQFNEV
jgi:hypothetical protein